MGTQNNISIPKDLKKENIKIKLKKVRLTVFFKISRIIKENIEKFLLRSTRVDFYLRSLKKQSKKIKKYKYLSMLVKREII